MKYITLTIALFCISGCCSQDMINKQLARCPRYVQDNVGDIKYYPISWGTLMMISGVTDKTTGEIWLTAWADEHTLFHEIAHSVYIRSPNKDSFKAEFVKQPGFVNIWSLNTDEEIAEAFTEAMNGKSNKKISLAKRFFDGKYHYSSY